MDRERLIAVAIGVWCTTVAVHADMTPVSQLDAERRQSAHVCGQADFRQTNSSSPFACFSVTDLDSWPVEFLSETSDDLTQICEIQHPQSLTSGPSSLNLCLSALIGLGLCSSAHYVKRLSFGFIPQWYHNGGPFQIGHSLAVNPDSVCPVAVCCLDQPARATENIMPQYRSGTIVSLWRKSQFTPDIIACRGPPLS